MVAYTPTIGPINADDLGGGLDSWFAYDGSKDGSPVSLGTFTNGSVGLAQSIDTCILSSTRAVVVLSDDNNSSYPTAILLDISGTTPSVLDSLVLKSAAGTFVRCAKVTSRYFAVQFESTGGKGRVVDTDGDALVAVGSEQTATYHDTSGRYGLGEWASDKIIVARRNAATTLGVSVISVDVGTGGMTYNAEDTQTVPTIGTAIVDVDVLDTSNVLVSFQDGSSLHMDVWSVAISGTTPTIAASVTGESSPASTPTDYYVSATEAGDYFFLSPLGGSTESQAAYSWNGSAATLEKSMPSQAIEPGMLTYMETVSGYQYFMKYYQTANPLDASLSTGRRPRLKAYRRKITGSKFFYPSDVTKLIENTATDNDTYTTDLRRISATKLLAVYRIDTGAYKVFIANQ